MMRIRNIHLFLLLTGFCNCAVSDHSAAETFLVTDYKRQTIYHSPQKPGFTCWVGAWTMPDGSIMTSFTQATGPIDGRTSAPREILEQLEWPPGGDAGFDMTGLDLRNVHLRSSDAGTTWSVVSADRFQTCMNGCTGEAELALRDGTVLRGVEGFYLPYGKDHPKTGFLQRSADGTRTWGKPEQFLDPKQYSAWPKRIRQLRDGRLIVAGGVAHVPAGSRKRTEYSKLFEPLLAVSSDHGRTWKGPIPVVPDEHRRSWGGEECDVAELANGDLLFVFRRPDREKPGHEVRLQGVMKKSNDNWTPAEVSPAPFPHSGHPELLATREGAILHLATHGVHWTKDAGRNWQRLDIPGTAYYPRSVQLADGQILVIGHIGGDDAYGKVDQSIVMDSFRLTARSN